LATDEPSEASVAEQAKQEVFTEGDPNPVNAIGKMVFEDLVSSGYEVDGTEECWKTCSATKPCGSR
jgi:hypothetical protein